MRSTTSLHAQRDGVLGHARADPAAMVARGGAGRALHYHPVADGLRAASRTARSTATCWFAYRSGASRRPGPRSRRARHGEPTCPAARGCSSRSPLGARRLRGSCGGRARARGRIRSGGRAAQRGGACPPGPLPAAGRPAGRARPLAGGVVADAEMSALRPVRQALAAEAQGWLRESPPCSSRDGQSPPSLPAVLAARDIRRAGANGERGIATGCGRVRRALRTAATPTIGYGLALRRLPVMMGAAPGQGVNMAALSISVVLIAVVVLFGLIRTVRISPRMAARGRAAARALSLREGPRPFLAAAVRRSGDDGDRHAHPDQ